MTFRDNVEYRRLCCSECGVVYYFPGDWCDRAQQAARIKKRAAAGTCPCCKRTFSNMAEHMKKEHAAFVVETGAKVVPIKAAT